MEHLHIRVDEGLDMITRMLGETDASFRARVLKHEADKLCRQALRTFLRKLGLKSARGISVSFAGMSTRVPGVY